MQGAILLRQASEYHQPAVELSDVHDDEAIVTVLLQNHTAMIFVDGELLGPHKNACMHLHVFTAPPHAAVAPGIEGAQMLEGAGGSRLPCHTLPKSPASLFSTLPPFCHAYRN